MVYDDLMNMYVRLAPHNQLKFEDDEEENCPRDRFVHNGRGGYIQSADGFDALDVTRLYK